MRRVGGGGLLLISGGEPSPNSYSSNHYYFRQDSSFRYLFGLDRPSLWGVVDLDSGESILYGDDPTLHDLVWTGVRPTIAQMGEQVGISLTRSRGDLSRDISSALSSGRRVHILPPYRGETKLSLSELLGVAPQDLPRYISRELSTAVANMRERKSREEIEQIESSYKIGCEMHTTAMRLTRPDIVEREVGGVLEGVARSMGGGVSFPPIYTQHGERLHNEDREGRLREGRLVLCDAGGETLSGYCSDHTRSYPVGGRFSSRQRDIYNVVLRAQRHIASIARAGVSYGELQRECYRVLGEGLLSLGLLRGSIEDVVESGAVSLFMPHGVGHGLGLDVHDCDALAQYVEGGVSCVDRTRWVLREGTVMTNEPGVYFIPELIHERRAAGVYRDLVAWDLVESYLDFGGVRIEDNMVITATGAYEIGSAEAVQIPRTVEEIENFMQSI